MRSLLAHLALATLAALGAQALLAAPAVAQTAPDRMRVPYRGELLDQANRPISGVFPLRFSLFRSEEATEPIWEETQWVSVFDGLYDVLLGFQSGLPDVLDGESRILAIAIGEGEITRQTIRLRRYVPEAEDPLPTIDYDRYRALAARAMRADEAGFAQDCLTLGGRSAGQLDRFDDLRDRLDELRARLQNDGGSRLNTAETVAAERVGGPGGNRYQRMCPPGFAMTGIRGGHGNLIDGFRPICTELE